MSRPRPAFTLIDLLITLTVMSVIIVIVVPLFADDTQSRLDAAARIMRSDIELAQVLSIADPAAPVSVKLGTAGCNPGCTSYELTSPDADTLEAGYSVTLGQGRALHARGVTFSLENIPSAALDFNGLGGLDGTEPAPAVRLALNGRSILLSISPTTGLITETTGP